MSKGRIVGLHGLPQVGKDSIGALFVERLGYTQVAFADPLYDEVAYAFNVDVAELRSIEWKTKPQMKLQPRLGVSEEFAGVCLKLGLFMDEPMTSRQIVQYWATEYRRTMYGDDYFVGKMIGRIRGLQGCDIVITDVRHDIEACLGHWLVSKGMKDSFRSIEILRHGTAHTGHSSDHRLSKFLIDAVVRNDTTLDECFDEITAVLEKGQEGRTNG